MSIEGVPIPIPPSTTTPRKALHITLSRDTSTTDNPPDPWAVLRAAVDADADDSVSTPIWNGLCLKEGGSDVPPTIEEMLSLGSQTFLVGTRASSSQINRRGKFPSSKPQDAGPLYRPFSTISSRDSPDPLIRRRSQSYGDLATKNATQVDGARQSSPNGDGFSTPKGNGSSSRLDKQASTGMLRVETDLFAWEDFAKTGFGDSPVTAGLTLSPSIALSLFNPVSPAVESLPNGTDGAAHEKPEATTFVPEERSKYALVAEEVVSMDDIFISFVEDGQLDPAATSTWAPFALVRLAKPKAIPSDSDKVFDCLLVTVRDQMSPSATEEKPAVPAPIVPTNAVASTSRSSTFGLGGITKPFQRPSPSGQSDHKRKNFFGQTLSKPAQRVDVLDRLSEDGGRTSPISAASLTSAGHPSIPDGDSIASSLAITHSNGIRRGTLARPSISNDSLPSDWRYKLEGSAHIVFEYRGTLSAYTGHVLRVSKISNPEGRDAVESEWREVLVPRLIPSKLLAAMTEVVLAETWTSKLMAESESARPRSRKMEARSSGSWAPATKAYLMEDFTYSHSTESTVLSIEIKVFYPKQRERNTYASFSRSGASSLRQNTCKLPSRFRLRHGIAVSACINTFEALCLTRA